MANKAKGFVISPEMKRPSGASYWIVSGMLNGKQEKPQFGSYAAAQAKAAELNAEFHGVKPAESLLSTRLNPDDLDRAELVMRQLKAEFPGVGLLDLLTYYRTLSKTFSLGDAQRIGPAMNRLRAKFPTDDLADACDWFVSNYQPPVSDITFGGAVENYLGECYRRRKINDLSIPQLERIENGLIELQSAIENPGGKPERNWFDGGQPLSHLSTGRLNEYLLATTRGRVIRDADGKPVLDKNKNKTYGPFSNKTWDNRRGILSGFFEFCRGRQYIKENPVSAIKSYGNQKKGKKKVAVLAVKEARELMAFLEEHEGGRLVPFYALALFAGIRPDWFNGEITKILPEHFLWKEREIDLPADITKTGYERQITIQPNLREWLKRYPIARHPIVFTGFQKANMRIRQKFKLTGRHDVLRHTFVSMFVGKFRSMAEAALQSGNSESIIKRHYFKRVRKELALPFWEIWPHKKSPAR